MMKRCGWLLGLLVLGLAALVQAQPVMDQSGGFYYDAFSDYDAAGNTVGGGTGGISQSQNVVMNTTSTTKAYFALATGFTTGWAISNPIDPSSFQGWLRLYVDKTGSAGDAVSFDVLNTAGTVLQSIVPSGLGAENFNLSGITEKPIRLRANLSKSSGNGPLLFSWKTVWTLQPNVRFSLTADNPADPLGVSVTAGTQLNYTLSCDINNVVAHNVTITVPLSAKDGYNMEMIDYAYGTASANTITAAKDAIWNLGTLGVGGHNKTFTVNVINGNINSVNSPTHSNGKPIQLQARFLSDETQPQGIWSSPAGNSIIGSGSGQVTTTYVSCTTTWAYNYSQNWIFNPSYALTNTDYTYVMFIAQPWWKDNNNDERLMNVQIRQTVPAGTTYVRSGLFRNPYTVPQYPFNMAQCYMGSTQSAGVITWGMNELYPYAGGSFAKDKGNYFYATVHVNGGAGTSFTVPPAFISSDQNQGPAAGKTNPYYSGGVVNVISQATYNSNLEMYAAQFDPRGLDPVIDNCIQFFPGFYISTRSNQPLSGAYYVQRVAPGTEYVPHPSYPTAVNPIYETYFQYECNYCWGAPLYANGDVVPKGNSTPALFWTRSDPSPVTPTASSVIWTPLTATVVPNDAKWLMTDLGNVNYSLYPYWDNQWGYTMRVQGGVPAGTVFRQDAYLYVSRTAITPIQKVMSPMTLGSSAIPAWGVSYTANTRAQASIQAGDLCFFNAYTYASSNATLRDTKFYVAIPPQFTYEPYTTGNSWYWTTFTLTYTSDGCGTQRTGYLEYSTTPGLYPFDRQMMERANWSRVQPLDLSKITGIRWNLGDWYYTGQLNINFYLRAKKGTADQTVINIPYYGVIGGNGQSAPTFVNVPITILSHTDMKVTKGKLVLPGKISYVLTGQNQGNMDEGQVMLWDKVPDLTDFDSTQAPMGTTIYYHNTTITSIPTSGWSNSDFGTSTTWLRWDFTSGPVETPLSVTLTVKPQASLPGNATINNTGYLWGAHGTTLTSNTIAVINSPDFSYGTTTNISVNPAGDVRTGTLLTYRIKYQNTGLREASNVTVTVQVDPKLEASTLDFFSGATGTYLPVTRTIEWDLGSVGIGVYGELVYMINAIAGVSPGGNINAMALISSGLGIWTPTNTVSNHLITEVHEVKVAPSPNLSGQKAEYLIEMVLGSEGALTAGQSINLEFPSSMQLPVELKAGEVEVNGVRTNSAGVITGQLVNILLPAAPGMGNSAALTLRIKLGAGLVNPVRGNYTLKVSTTRESLWKTALFSILTGIENNQLLVAPNPVKGEVAKFFYNLDGPAVVEITLYNILGEKVAQITENKPAGTGQNSEWHVSKVGSGIYLCTTRVRYNDGREVKFPVKKIVITKP